MKIEKVTIQDAQDLLKIYSPYVEKTAITFEYVVPSLEEFIGRIENISAKYPYIKAVSDDGEIVGYAYAGTFKGRKAYDWSVETTIYIKKEARGAGIGRLLYDALEKALASMGILNVNACIAYTDAEDEYLTNDSMHFHEKLGYQMVGTFHQCGYKFNRWYDMIWMEKIIGDHCAKQPNVTFGKWEI